MPRLVLPLVMAASLLPGVAHAADLPDPLGLHGFNLGMTLAEPSKSSGIAYIDKALGQKVTPPTDAKAKPDDRKPQ